MEKSQDSYNNYTLKHVDDNELTLAEIIISLIKWWKYLWSKWIIILTAGIIGGAIAVFPLINRKTLYIAELSFVLEDNQSGGGMGGYSGLASMVGIDLGNTNGGGIFAGDNLIEFMRSRAMIEKTLMTSIKKDGKELTLAEFYIDINGFRKSWKKGSNIYFSPNEDRSKFSREKDSLLSKFYHIIVNDNLFIARKDKKLSIITVTVKTENEFFSKCFTENLVKVVSEFYIETRTKKSAKNVAILQHQTDSIRKALFSGISGIAISMDVNPSPNPARQILRAPSQNLQADVQVNSAILQSLAPNLELAKVTLQKETPLIQEIDKPIMPLKIERASRIKRFLIGGVCGGFFIVVLLVVKKAFSKMTLNINQVGTVSSVR